MDLKTIVEKIKSGKYDEIDREEARKIIMEEMPRVSAKFIQRIKAANNANEEQH